MSTLPSNIRVFVHWIEPTVFAGEEIECQITFRNIATNAAPQRTSLHPNAAAGFYERQRKPTATQARRNTPQGNRSTTAARGHRATVSLNASLRSDSLQPGRVTSNLPPSLTTTDTQNHKRSLSIVSIGGNENTEEGQGIVIGTDHLRRPSKGHGRSASLQVVPRKQTTNKASGSPRNQRTLTSPSPLITSVSSTISKSSQPEELSVRQPDAGSTPNGPVVSAEGVTKKKAPAPFPLPFTFPAPSGNIRSHNVIDSDAILSPRTMASAARSGDQTSPAARVLSPASIAGTPRSSGEFYSLSNNSTETLASEYQSQQNPRGAVLFGNNRRSLNLASTLHHRTSEILMMGYAQIHGSFTLDSALIDQSSFDDIKRKGAIGGQGGGVIGVDTNKRDSGLLRGFGWGNIGDSLGGLLGGSELSSMKDMRGIANSRSIPLLSAPQSIIFVNLRLGPGESSSYNYSFKLPRGLPPSHRGKAMKVGYKLIIGVQRPGGVKEQQVKSVEVPFRLLGSVNSHGELLGHDLMSPYIILQDQARIQANHETLSDSLAGLGIRNLSKSIQASQDNFLLYVDQLLTNPRQGSNAGLLSPSGMTMSRRQSQIEEATTAREAINLAILRSNVATESHQSANRFEIARSGRRVAVVMLARPSYRLGETVNCIIDFTDADIPCYAIHASLESSERVQPSIALRSEASILRATRKTHSSHSESTIFSRRVEFSPAIPTTATPEFITSGISLDWRIRVEFVTPRLVSESEGRTVYPELLEEVMRDDRGATHAATEALDCESFEVAVPLRVYGAAAVHSEHSEASIDGLSI